MPKTLTLIGFDFGLKHIGVAVGQTLTRTATALTSIKAQQGEPEWHKIAELIKTWQPDALVVGDPLNMDGSTQALTTYARAFAQTLEEKFKLPVYLLDERLSTVEARSRLFESGGYKALKKDAIDSLSAKLVLDHWLAHH